MLKTEEMSVMERAYYEAYREAVREAFDARSKMYAAMGEGSWMADIYSADEQAAETKRQILKAKMPQRVRDNII